MAQWKWKKKDNLAVSFSSLINNVLGSFASLLTLIVMKCGNIWLNALDLTINTLFILRVDGAFFALLVLSITHCGLL